MERYAIHTCVAAALLAGCARLASSPALPSAAASPAAVSPATGDLLYASASAGNAIYKFTYPLGRQIGKIVPPKGTYALQGLCTDSSGSLYVTALASVGRGYVEGEVDKYDHDGGQFLFQWKFGGLAPFGCSYDKLTRNLAISMVSLGVSAGALFVINTGSLGSSVYYDNNISNFYYCGYDGKGNLFVDGQGEGTQMYFAELRKGAQSFTDIALPRDISLSGMGQVQWDGHYITVEDLTASAIYRLRISGTKATLAGTTHLTGWNGPTLSWIKGSAVTIPTGSYGTSLHTWRYPSGGKPTKTVKASGGLFSVTVSSATSK